MIHMIKDVSEKKALIPVVGAMRILHFREAPYRYAGSFGYEDEYLSIYLDEDAFFLIAGDPESSKIDGILTAIPFSKVHSWFGDAGEKFRQKGYNLDDIIYLGELIISPELKGQSVGRDLIKTFLSDVESGYKACVFCTHQDNTTPNDLYKKIGFFESGITVENQYPTIEGFSNIQNQSHKHIFLEKILGR